MPVAARSIANLRVGGGRPGMPSKVAHSIKEMIERALTKAGGVEYLTEQAHKNPVAFMALVARVMPLQLANADGQKLEVEFRWADAPPKTIESTAVDTAVTSVDTADKCIDSVVADETTTVTFIGECGE